MTQNLREPLMNLSLLCWILRVAGSATLLSVCIWKGVSLNSTKKNKSRRDSKTQPESRCPEKTPEESRTCVSQMLRSQHADDRGFALGGELLAWVDIVAGVTAKRHAEKAAVTASMDAVHFFSPLKIGDICSLSASVNRSWNSSMEIGVLVEGENMLTGIRHFCCYALLTFVAVENGKPVPVPSLVPKTLQEIENWEQAELRRQARTLSRKENAPYPIEQHCLLFSEQIANKKYSTTRPKRVPSKRKDRASISLHSGDVKRILDDGSSPSMPPLEPVPSSPDSKDEQRQRPLPPPIRPLSRSASDSYTEIIEIVFPEHANSLGITFGGQIIRWMEYTAVMAAAKHCRSHLLTASMDSVNFLRPTRVGDVVLIKGIVTQAFAHSVEVYVTVETESLAADSRVMTNNGWLTIVAVDDHGDLVQVPNIVMEDERQDAEIEAARKSRGQARRERRLKERALLASLFLET